ncbi:MAG TPA: hypothetical protein VK999_08985 [Methylotenera sp.]|nr:hypothetical protein [Methylotenera sp.]
MILRKMLAAEYSLNARVSSGQRLETDTVDSAEYTLDFGGEIILTKTLNNGLEIRHSDALGDGFIFVNISNNELILSGKIRQRLTITKCDGSTFPVALRPEYIQVED